VTYFTLPWELITAFKNQANHGRVDQVSTYNWDWGEGAIDVRDGNVF
jgi:hypothetical protein